jgi:hypothetical protein
MITTNRPVARITSKVNVISFMQNHLKRKDELIVDQKLIRKTKYVI